MAREGDQKRVLVTDGVSSRGLELLAAAEGIEVVESKTLNEQELLEKLPEFDGLVVRSATKVSRAVIEKCEHLKVIGRAGVGVDTVDVEAATEKGVVVMNTPGGNTISTAELTFTMLLSLARRVPQANASVKAGEWQRKRFQGTEVNGKILGIIGMGRIGSEVARRAIAFGMRVLAFDPYISVSRARSLQVELYEDIEEMLPHCDFITLHMPMTPETRGILNKKRLGLCKDGVRVVNCARGGLVTENDLYEALKEGKVEAAALDVYEEEPPSADFAMRSLDQVVMTPHLGASTAEAQESVGIEVAESVRDFLLHGIIRNAVNMPNVDSKTLERLHPYLEFAAKLGHVLAHMAPARCEELIVNYSGKMRELDTTPITRAALKGFLRHVGGRDVNEVSAPKYAENLGLSVSETKKSDDGEFSELISLSVKSCDGKCAEIAGTFYQSSARIVKVNGYSLEARPEGVVLMMENEDRPGIVGWIGSLLGKHQINIANMSLSRSEPGTHAFSLFNLDSKPSQEVIDEIMKDSHIVAVTVVEM